MLYQRHSLTHHAVFTHENMGLQNARELVYVFFPYAPSKIFWLSNLASIRSRFFIHLSLSETHPPST